MFLLQRSKFLEVIGVVTFGVLASFPCVAQPKGESPNPAEPSAPPVRQAPEILAPGALGVGGFLPDFAFSDLRNEPKRLSDLRSHKGVVIAMTSTTCPISKKYIPTLVELARTYSQQGIAFLLVNSIPADKIDEMREIQERFGDTAIYIFDEKEALAQAVGARTTTDVVVLDGSQTVVYRGAIDDQYGFGYAIDAPRHRYLAEALDGLLEGKMPRVSATSAPGCTLELPMQSASEEQVTYHQQIARLMQRHCVECHRSGGVAPFSLESYDDVVAHAPMIREVTERGVMPPWFAAPVAEGAVSPWINDRSLAHAEKARLMAWIERGKPEGDPKLAPQSKDFPEGWLIGKPDAVFEFAEPVQIQATGTMPYKNVFVETDLPEDRWVQAIEIRPGDPSVVHHVLVFAQKPSDAEDATQEEEEDERLGYWGIYVPGNSALMYPNGIAKRLPQGARLRFQMHYTPNGTATTDRTRIGLVFAKEPPKHEVHVAGIVNTRLRIPPGADNHQEVASIRVPADVQVLGFLPHMHLRGKAARYELIRSSGTETLLDIPRYDFNWQLLYKYTEPLPVKAGDTLRFTAWFDNSSGNPANPDPSRTVAWGPQTEDEMHLGYVEYIVPGEIPGEGSAMFPRRGARRPGGAIAAKLLFRRLDADGDGSITRDEVRERLPDNPNAAGPIFDRLDRNGDGRLDLEEFETLQKLLQR
jgi:thiol-disulfide isomerase/thioredoxin